ncbi:uncharacterized protein LOC122402358 [Colletes gigas]|uniref:uncharacterized protein LOC122402358 n=1 Tax=Colletes gigas TaxID=935657 RepID=UPI001C9AAF3E|nr:uncharacterized protein LOC122402358 [Colletes gigas]
MVINLLLIFVLVNITHCQAHLQNNYALNTILEETTNFFEKLKSDYAFKSLNKDILAEINGNITKHMQNSFKQPFNRYKREIREVSNKGIDVLNEFEDFEQLNFNVVRNINFFSLQNELQTTWFIAILVNLKISVYRIENHIFHSVADYTLINGKEMFVHSCAYGSALLIVQNEDGSILILRFSEAENKYDLSPIQDFEPNDITHIAIWQGMNQLYLGIASRSNISIYVWFRDYFDLVHTINHDTKKLIPFYSKGFMYLAVTGPTTLIFKYFIKSNEFAITQRLPSSQDVSSFQLIEGHFMEHFLSLSIDSSIVIYKEIHDRFVPFQQISPGSFTVPIVSNKAIVILSLHEDTILIYQYDGWRFVKLNIELSGVRQFRKITLYGKDLLLIKYTNDTWALKQPVWTKKNSNKDLQDEIRIWNINAMNMAQRIPKEIPDSENPVKILKGHINKLLVRNINEHNSQALKDVSKQYKRVISKLREQKGIINSKFHSNNLTLVSLHAKNIRVKCKTKCKVNRLNIKGNSNPLSKLQATRNNNRILNFEAINVTELKNWKCPLFSLPIESIVVGKSINEMSLNDLQENVLKVIGNQEVIGEHIFYSMNVIDASMRLNIATNLTKTEIHTREIKVKELNLATGGILLPLNGPPTTMNGSIKASKVKVKNDIRLRGKLFGDSRKSLLPVTIIPEHITIKGGSILSNTRIENLRSGDLITNKASSVKDILSNVVSLRDNVSVSLIFSSEKTKWNNVILHGFQDWVTADSLNSVTISGRKHILQNVGIEKSTYETVKFPDVLFFVQRIETPVCGVAIIVPEIKTTTLVVDNIRIKRLKSSRVFGSLGEIYSTQNTISLFKPFDLIVERFYHNVTVKNVSAIRINNVNLTEMERLVNLWTESNNLKSKIETMNLVVGVLRSPVQFRIEVPKVIRNMVSEQNVHVGSVNNVNIIDFLANAVKLDDVISLGNITFDNGFTTNRMYTSYRSFNLTQLKENPNLHKKRISGNIETNAINLPYSTAFVESEIPSNIAIIGTATFPIEPTIRNINKINLKELFTRIWMATDFTVFRGKNLRIINAQLKRNILLNNSLNTLNLETWKNISERILSKTKSQEITVPASLKNIETPVIIGSSTPSIKCLDSNFNDAFDNALIRHKPQEVTAKWTFDKLKVLDKLHAMKKINDLNFKTDIMRHNSTGNIVTGKKTVVVLTAENLNGLNFDEWADNALMKEKKSVTIKGRKYFNTVTINNINVSGTIMGHNIEEALSKSADQTLHGEKTIQGFFNTPMLVIDSLVNDVNLTDLMSRQLKKKEQPLQIIKTKIKLQNVLKIVGNLTVNDTYGKAEFKNSYKAYSNLEAVEEKMRKYSKISETINVALRNRAVYVNKLEVVKETNAINASNENISFQKEQCGPKNFSRLCANERVVNIISKLNSSDFVMIKSVSLDKEEFVIWIKFDSVSIYLYNNIDDSLSHLKDLHIPNIIDAFVESMSHSLWIILRLISQTLALRYQPWNDVQEYVLPATDVFKMSWFSNGQLLLLLSDGVWNLEGLASPQNVINIPLKGKVVALIDGPNYYVKCSSMNNVTLMKARYVGN